MVLDFKDHKFINNDKEYKISYLEDIDFSKMEIVKNLGLNINNLSVTNNHTRIIYYNNFNKSFYKIWAKDYINNEAFTYAIQNNIFDNDLILPLQSLIFDKEYICRGYITYKSILENNLDIHEIPSLFNKLKKNIERTQFMLVDPGGGGIRNSNCNIVKYKNQYTLIDYECIYPLNYIVKGLVRCRDCPQYICMKIKYNTKLNISPKPYYNFIKNNYKLHFEKGYMFDFENKSFLNKQKKYSIVFLEDINFSNFKVVKERKHRRNDTLNHYRIIYNDRKNKLYYKVWEKEYIHNKSFTKAILNNIYDNDLILPLKSLIFDKEKICRGYITFEGEPSDKDMIEIPELYKKYNINILNSKWILCDPVKINIVKYQGLYTFIDYEAIYPLKKVIKRNKGLCIQVTKDFEDEIKPEFYSNYLINKYFNN